MSKKNKVVFIIFLLLTQFAYCESINTNKNNKNYYSEKFNLIEKQENYYSCGVSIIQFLIKTLKNIYVSQSDLMSFIIKDSM